jgi:hypothetical protein
VILVRACLKGLLPKDGILFNFWLAEIHLSASAYVIVPIVIWLTVF